MTTLEADLQVGPPLAVVASALAGLRDEDLALLPACCEIMKHASDRNGRAVAAIPKPEMLGETYERALAEPNRRRGGVWYTPRILAEGLTRRALKRVEVPAPRILDPACGSGAFLLAAGRALAEHSGPECLSQLAGWDVDADALLVAHAALELFAWKNGWDPAAAQAVALTEANFLSQPTEQLTLDGDCGIPEPTADVIVGNPPFLSQLRARTARDKVERAVLRTTHGAAAGGYVDAAALFLHRSIRCVSRDGVVCLVLPASVLGTRDARTIRKRIESGAAITALWIDGRPRAFHGSVPVCAPVLKRTVDQGAVERWRGLGFEPLGTATLDAASWAPLLVDRREFPACRPRTGGVQLGDVATVTADFRDQYYGLAPLVHEANEQGPPRDCRLVVTGLVDPAQLLWGQRPARFDRRSWVRPAVDRDELLRTPALEAWANARLAPKILVATQTRVLEAVVDPLGEWVPVPPLLNVLPTSVDPYAAAAAISSPVATLWAWERGAGTAMSLDALKLSAAQLRELPMPSNEPALAEAAEVIRDAHDARTVADRRALLRIAALASCRAYGLDREASEAATAWWLARLPSRRDVVEPLAKG